MLIYRPRVRNTHLLRHCILKTIILPRQAWDRHDESSEQMLLFAGDGGVSGNGAPDPSAYPHYLKMQRALLATGRDIGTKTVFFVCVSTLHVKNDRFTKTDSGQTQGRTQKRPVFLGGVRLNLGACGEHAFFDDRKRLFFSERMRCVCHRSVTIDHHSNFS